MEKAQCSNAFPSETLESEAGVSDEAITEEPLYDEEIGEYYFESDHLALKGNEDYRNLLKCVALLEAQRMKAIQDLDRLVEAKEEALENPIDFVEKLQRKEDLNLPQPQHLINLPSIDWDQYTHSLSLSSLAHKHMTRHKKPTCHASSDQNSNDNNNSGGSSSTEVKAESDDQSSVPILIRGRPLDTGKPQTFNQLWTVEEQKRLEDLLLKYPPEEVEARRWKKIAKALGNRTSQQVASRVQKYFIKLTKAGLPVPGRTPNLHYPSRKPGIHRHQRHNKFYFNHSTFFTSHEPLVFMSEYDDDTTNQSATSSMDSEQIFNWETDKRDDDPVPQGFRDSEEYQELLYLKKLRKTKAQDRRMSVPHVGFRCCKCGCEPIFGTRWHCIDCPPSSNLNLCDGCNDGNFETSDHVIGHRLEPVEESQHTFIDGDYTQFVHGSYNYLDPNYMPAA